MEKKKAEWLKGMQDGIPICLGYIAVSFTFGIVAKTAGLTWLQAVVMSAANLTSAGQLASLSIISAAAGYLEMAMTQLVINLRYCLMSCALSQKLDPDVPLASRMLMAYGVTDEIFGVSVCRAGKLSPYYNYGLISVAMPGWVLGTLLGVISGNIFSQRVVGALSIGIYGMFIAVIIPPAKKDRVLAGLIGAAMAASWLFTRLPVLREISSGFRIIILTLVLAGAAAVLFPVKEEREE